MKIRSALLFAISAMAAAQSWGQQLPQQPVVLNTLWRVSFGNDYATTAVPAERDAHSPSGVLYYVPSSNTDISGAILPGTAALYRLVNPSVTDHMDSLSVTEGDYVAEGGLGYPWTTQSAHSGLAPITRIYDNQVGNPWTADHALIVGPDALHAGESFPYYIVEGAVGYGYPRYLNSDRSLYSVQGGGVTIRSNAATGGSVWEWWWNGIQFINDYDYGRQLSATLQPWEARHTPMGPTAILGETGDAHSGPSIPIIARHSSPCLFVNTSGSTQSSRAIPLEWSPEDWGGDVNHPVIYPDVQIGKNISLNWIGPDGVDRNWPVVLYETVVSSPPLDHAVVEAPTGYLNAQFTTYYEYDPATRSLTPVSVYHGHIGFGPGPHALILASGPGMSAAAMGVYKNDPNAGLTLYDQSGPDGGQYGSSFTKWGVHYDSNIYANWTFKTWIMTDTVQNVVSYIDQLYAWGVTSRN